MRPTHAEIDLSAIAFNIQQIKKRVLPAKVMAVVKANGYGHGMEKVAKTALTQGASYLGVALMEEGLQLRAVGIDAPILVFGGVTENQSKLFVENHLDVTLSHNGIVDSLVDAAKASGVRAKVHIKIDTGMGRVGIDWRTAAAFAGDISSIGEFDLVGVYTHFATSDERDKTFANLQLQRFRVVLSQLHEKGIDAPLIHAANSGAILDLPDSYFNLVRPGVMMYGYYPSNETTESVSIRPAMSIKTRVLQVKEIDAGSSVSYGRIFITPQKTRIAILPIGYGDGYNRLLSNTGQVLIRGKRYPIVGRVCMDLVMVDIGLQDTICEDDEVVLLGRQRDEEITIYEICDKLGTIPYEITCWVSERVPRIYKQDDTIADK